MQTLIRRGSIDQVQRKFLTSEHGRAVAAPVHSACDCAGCGIVHEASTKFVSAQMIIDSIAGGRVSS